MSDAELPAEIELMPARWVHLRPYDGLDDWHSQDLEGVVAETQVFGGSIKIDYEPRRARSRER